MSTPPPCPDHKEVQHRDQKPPWCNTCGWSHGRPASPPLQVTDTHPVLIKELEVVECPNCHSMGRHPAGNPKYFCSGCGRVVTIHASGLISDADRTINPV